MPAWTQWLNRIRHFGRQPQFEKELGEELNSHVEERAAELEESGLERATALAQARRETGSMAQVREEARAAWSFRWLEEFRADLRYAARSFRRTPVFTLTAILSLALGIGANTAIFTALDAALWKPLPVADPGTLVNFSISRKAKAEETDLPAAFALQLRRSNLFTGVILTGDDGLSFVNDGRAERIVGEVVSPDFFSVLGVQPLLGQAFTSGVREGHWSAETVLSYGFWKQRFGGDPNVIGRTIHLNTYPFTIVGVSPPSFSGLVRGTDYELRIPMLPEGQSLGQMQMISASPDDWITTTARLRPGETLAQAEAAADAQLQEFLRVTPIERFRAAGLLHLHLSLGGRGDYERTEQFRAPLYVLLSLVAIVLLIACTNVANMLLARASARGRELALRASIGASRGRLIRQMLTESVLLSLVGGIFGIGVARWAAQVLFHFIPQGHISIVLNLDPDNRALFFTFAVSLLTGVLFGLVPAVQATRGDLAAVPKSDSAASVGARGGLRKALVIAQVAFSLVLLVVAGLFLRTLFDLRPAGFHTNAERVLLFTMKPQQEIYTTERKRVLVNELARRISNLPGVQSAAFAEGGPLGSRTSRGSIETPGRAAVRADTDSVTPGFFDTIGIPLVAGRDFTAGDTPSSPLVAIVNQSLGRALFGNENPVGRHLLYPYDNAVHQYEVVGIVADVHYYDVHAAPRPGVWLALQQDVPYMPTLHVRIASSDTSAMIAAVRREFDAVDKGFPVFNVKTFEMRIEDSLSRERMVANLSAAFGLLALLLAAVGLNGILAYSVTRRTREIGIRVALGARRSSIVWLMAREALLVVGAGVALGVVAGIVAGRMVASQLYGVSAADPASLAGATAAIFVIAVIAACMPALRAARLDPLTALRHE
jgi:predicted permease